jgi:hypothetical protein
MASTASSNTLQEAVDVGSRVDHRQRDAPPIYHNARRFEPFLPLSVGFAPLFLPPGGGYACRVQRCPVPVDLLRPAQTIQELVVQPLPHARFVPFLEASPEQVMPDPQPISWGNISQGMALLSTNKMPVSAARSSMRGLAPLGLGGSSGKSGSITYHSSSVTSSLAMISTYPLPRFVRCT